MKFEDLPVPRMSLRIRAPEWQPDKWRKDPFAEWGDEVPVQSVRTDPTRLASFQLVAAGMAFCVSADRPVEARLLSDRLAGAGALLARLRDRDARGGWNLEIAFFARKALDMGPIQVEVDDSSKSLLGKEGTYLYTPKRAKDNGAKDGDVPCWFFVKPAFSWGEDDDLKGDLAKAASDSFCIIGDDHRFVVQRGARTQEILEADGNRIQVEESVFRASKATRYRSERSGDTTILLVSGTLAFRSHAEVVRLQAEAQLQTLVKDEKSYLRNWDAYNELEGETQLEKAREIGAIRYVEARPSRGGTILKLAGISEAARNCLKEKSNLELEVVSDIPEWIDDPSWSVKRWLETCAAPAAKKADDSQPMDDQSGTASQKNGKAAPKKQDEGRDVGVEWKFVRESNELEWGRGIDAIPETGFVVYSLSGFLESIRRRDKARRRIMAGASANPMLGVILEPDGVISPLEKRKRVPALSVHARSLFKEEPTPRQLEAIDVALNTPDIALIQGPPGTGKTTVITAILDRLQELAPKNGSGKGSVLLCGFQHDAVENMIDRIKVNSLPVPKFGKRNGGAGESGEAVADRKRREWCEGVAAKVRAKNPQLAEAEEERRIRDLAVQYAQAPGPALAKELCRAILDLPASSVSTECRKRAQTAFLESDKRSGVAADSRLLSMIRALRVTERGFRDDGADRAADLLDEPGISLSDADRAVLRKASDWMDGDSISFLPELRSLKRTLLACEAPPPAFVVEKHSSAMLSLVRDTLASLHETGMTSRDRRTAALLAFVEELEGDPDGMLDAVADYSFALAATCQQCDSPTIKEAKGVRKKGKNATREFQHLVYDYVIVDEAARATPLDLLIPMSQGKRILLVGDHRQLPQMVDEELAKKLEQAADKEDDGDGEEKKAEELQDDKWWKESMFEHLFTTRIPELEKIDGIRRRVTLNAQFRMHPLLGEFVSRNFYSLEERFVSPLPPEHYAHPFPVAGGGPVLWIDVPAKRGESKRLGGKLARDCESDIIVKRLRKWMETDPNKNDVEKRLSFGVISFYRGQVEAIKEKLKDDLKRLEDERNSLAEDIKKKAKERLRVGTVDSFQGKEFDIVFLSLVRESSSARGAHPFGFLTVYNRLNVAMSRQKKLLVAVGDADFFRGAKAEAQVPGLAAFLDLCQSRGAVEGDAG